MSDEIENARAAIEIGWPVVAFSASGFFGVLVFALKKWAERTIDQRFDDQKKLIETIEDLDKNAVRLSDSLVSTVVELDKNAIREDQFNAAVASLREEFKATNKESEERIVSHLKEMKDNLNAQLNQAIEVAKIFAGANK